LTGDDVPASVRFRAIEKIIELNGIGPQKGGQMDRHELMEFLRGANINLTQNNLAVPMNAPFGDNITAYTEGRWSDILNSPLARTIANSVSNMGCMSHNEKAEWVPVGCDQVPTIENGGAKFVGEGADKHLEVTYKIKKGWRWTDGTPVTSKDTIYSWKLQMDPEFEIGARDNVEKLYDIVAVDDSTFTTKFLSQAQAKQAAAGTLKGNVAFDKFRDDFGWIRQAAVVDPVYWNVGWAAGQGWAHILEKIPAKDQAKADWSRKPVFDGPYVLKEWKAGQELVWEKSDKPFPLGDAKVKTVIFRFFAETAAVISALQKGEIDAVTGTGGLTVASAPDLDKIEAAQIQGALPARLSVGAR
jgi:peptide/nickel transport system substrate-binding protein